MASTPKPESKPKPRVRSIYRCSDCPWFRIYGVRSCAHFNVVELAVRAHSAPPAACPLRERAETLVVA